MESPDRDGGFGVKDVDFSFGAQQVLRKVTFSMLPGEIHALVGRHGEGKSTLCGIITGRLAPASGEVVANGRSYPSLNPNKARELGIAGQSSPPRIYPTLTVLKNLVTGDSASYRMGFLPVPGLCRRVEAWLKENGMELPLSSTMREIPRELWVVVETLAKLRQNPRLLVMDGALEELKQPWVGRLMSLIRKHLDAGMGLMIVTHNIENALDMANRITVMRRGQILLTDSVANIERLNLIRMCYAQLDGYDEHFASQERFHELLRYTEAIIRDLPTTVIIFSTDLHIRFVNRAGRRMFADALENEENLLTGENGRLLEALRSANASGQDAELHAVPITAGGRTIIADVRIQAIHENNVKVGSMLIIEDISIREELRRRLLLSEQLESIGLLAAGVAHEVNNPLEILGNYLNYLRDAPDSQDAGEIMFRMEDELARIHQIVNNLIAGAGKKSVGATVDVAALALEVTGLLRFHGGLQAVEFIHNQPAGDALVQIGQTELRQVFLNLIRNSMDAMPDGGVIRIDTEISEIGGAPSVVIRFIDNGPGIKLDNSNDIFLPFISTKKDGGSHQGLGLYIVYSIVEKYGGGITVTNIPGGGCEFKIVFPLAQANVQ